MFYHDGSEIYMYACVNNCCCFVQNYVLKKMLTKRKVNSQMCKVEFKLILLSMYYNLFEIIGVVHFIYFYTTANGVITEYFICESTGESDCQQDLSDATTSAILLRFNFIIWSLSPIMMILLKTNVFKHIKNYFKKACSKKTIGHACLTMHAQ